MPRLSDRAYQTLKAEVERHYSSLSDGKFSQEQHLEQMILLARLDTLHHRSGRTMTKAQLWEEVCDILPNIDRKILKQSSRVDPGSPAVGASVGISAVGIGAAAVLMAGPLNTGEMIQLSGVHNAHSGSPVKTEITHIKTHYAETFDTAKAFGWQAVLKGQNPPHSAAHWRETAGLWQQAIALLGQIPEHDGYYRAAQQKKAFYQVQLNHIQARQIAAQNAASERKSAPQFSRDQLSRDQLSKSQLSRTQPSKNQVIKNPATKAQAAKSPAANNRPKITATAKSSQNDPFILAKQQGWQAAIAAQNAPHPVEKWVAISRQWQLAIETLNRVDSQHPNYAEAQQKKAQYTTNLIAIRQRYQAEQDANQSLQSLKASLRELEATFSGAKRTQMEAIVTRLRTIPAGTVAHQEAQQLIAKTTQQIKALPPTPTRLATFSQ